MIAAVSQLPGWATVVIAVCTATLVVGFVSSGPVAILTSRAGRRLPEVKGGYDAAEIRRFLHSANAHGPHTRSGKALYRLEVQHDILFILLFTLGASLVVDGTWGRAIGIDQMGWRIAGLLPILLLGISDLVEDLLLLPALGSDDNQEQLARPHLVPFASIATTFKRWLVVVASALTVIGSFLLAAAWPDPLFG
jgi:hypothetical protein